jgi:hypothetical protein
MMWFLATQTVGNRPILNGYVGVYEEAAMRILNTITVRNQRLRPIIRFLSLIDELKNKDQ